MNSPLEQNYYELLEIPRDATLAEIERAYERAQAYYGADSVAVYALASPEDLKRVQDRIDEAYLVLSDEPLRREYDGRLGPPGPDERPSRAEVRRAREEKEAPAQPAASKPEPVPEPPTGEAASVEPRPEPVRAEPPKPEPEAKPPEPIAEAEPAPEPPKPEPEPIAEAKPPEPAPEPPKPEPVAEAKPVEPAAPAPEPVAVEAPKVVELPKVEEPPKQAEPRPEPVRVVAEGPMPPPTMAQPEPAPRIAIGKRDSKSNESSAGEASRPALRPQKPELPPDAIFSGELLRQLRESLGLSLQEIADRTKIGKPHLENIEADRFAALPAQVYLRGFLMSLARELRLDPLRVSKSYLEQMGDAKGRAAAKPRS